MRSVLVRRIWGLFARSCPRLSCEIDYWRRNKYFEKALSPIFHPRLTLVRRQAMRHANGAIISGTFKGMRFDENPLSLPIVLGTYELEIQEVFERLGDQPFSRIIDIGAAEGYYAVGVAQWKPNCTVTAFEANPMYHDSIRNLAQCNGVLPRVDIQGECNPEDLRALGDELIGAFIIMDVEGYEKELLDPEKVPHFKSATILVEVHDCFVPGCDEAIRRRFENSHTISSFVSRERFPSEYPIKSGISKLGFMSSALVYCSSDGRTEPNGWLLLEPV